jgi:outer membrane protein OmpA-like peptidoglycan-associated protein
LVARGVAAQRIAIDGRGEREPIASNDTDAGRAQNRRVEIFIAEAAPAQ